MASQTSFRRALIVADGDVGQAIDLGRWNIAEGVGTLVIAADGGLRKAQAMGLQPTLVVGDADSLDAAELAELAGRGIELRRHPADKDASDTELAVRAAVDQGAREIVVLGALGGLRFDHALANLLMLSLPELDGRDVAIVDGQTTVRLMNGPAALEVSGREGDLVSLLPLSGEVGGVHTRGLRYGLAGEVLEQGPSRGLSNVIEAPPAHIEIERGRLAVLHTRMGGNQ